MKRVLVILTVVMFYSCVSKDDYKELEWKNQVLNSQLTTVTKERDSLSIELQTLKNNQMNDLRNKVNNQHIYRSIEEAKAMVEDYYQFSNRDFVYRNPLIRRIDNNTFKVSVEECTNKGSFKDDDFHWHSVIYKLVVNDDESYVMVQTVL